MSSPGRITCLLTEDALDVMRSRGSDLEDVKMLAEDHWHCTLSEEIYDHLQLIRMNGETMSALIIRMYRR